MFFEDHQEGIWELVDVFRYDSRIQALQSRGNAREAPGELYDQRTQEAFCNSCFAGVLGNRSRNTQTRATSRVRIYLDSFNS